MPILQPATTVDELILQVKHLLGENESLKAQLLEYRIISDQQISQIRSLESQLAAANEVRSNLDEKGEELEFLQYQLNQVKQKMKGANARENEMRKEIGDTLSVLYKAEDIEQQYAHIQVQLQEMQDQVQLLTNRNLQYQQQASRIAELESALNIAEETITAWQQKASGQSL